MRVELKAGFCVDDGTARVCDVHVELKGDWTAYDAEGVRSDVERAVMESVRRRVKRPRRP